MACSPLREMAYPIRSWVASIATALVVAGASPALADGDADEKLEDTKTRWGFGAKVRRAWVTPYIQQLFMEDTPGTATLDGAGFDFNRRKGGTEVVFGFGYDRLFAKEGYYVEKGGMATAPGDVDYVTFRKPRWWTVELTVINHVRIHKFAELRFGGGIGLGIVRGAVRKTDAVCTTDNLKSDCMIDPMAVEVDQKADIPPVLPVVNALIGFQIRPFDFLHLHVDAGLHTVPTVSVGASLYLW